MKVISEMEILNHLETENKQLVKERLILEEVFCLIQCDEVSSQWIEADGELFWAEFDENRCVVFYDEKQMEILFDSIRKVFLRVDY